MDGPEYPQINNLSINFKGIEKVFRKLKVSNASEPDDLPAYILKELAEKIALIITSINTLSLQDSSLP